MDLIQLLQLILPRLNLRKLLLNQLVSGNLRTLVAISRQSKLSMMKGL